MASIFGLRFPDSVLGVLDIVWWTLFIVPCASTFMILMTFGEKPGWSFWAWYPIFSVLWITASLLIFPVSLRALSPKGQLPTQSNASICFRYFTILFELLVFCLVLVLGISSDLWKMMVSVYALAYFGRIYFIIACRTVLNEPSLPKDVETYGTQDNDNLSVDKHLCCVNFINYWCRVGVTAGLLLGILFVQLLLGLFFPNSANSSRIEYALTLNTTWPFVVLIALGIYLFLLMVACILLSIQTDIPAEMNLCQAFPEASHRDWIKKLSHFNWTVNGILLLTVSVVIHFVRRPDFHYIFEIVGFVVSVVLVMVTLSNACFTRRMIKKAEPPVLFKILFGEASIVFVMAALILFQFLAKVL